MRVIIDNADFPIEIKLRNCSAKTNVLLLINRCITITQVVKFTFVNKEELVWTVRVVMEGVVVLM